MKILHVIPSISPVQGGTSRAALDMVLALQKVGMNSEIATTNDHGANILPVLLNQKVVYEQVPVRFFSKLYVNNASINKFTFSRGLTKWLWQNMASYHVIHVHGLFSYPSTVAMLIARLKNLPYITTPHGLLCEWSLEQAALKKQLFMTLIERANLRRSRALHLTSSKEQQEVDRLALPNSSFVLPLGLDMPTLVPNASAKLRTLLNITDGAPIILFMGRLHYKKGLDYLIPALGQLKKTMPFHFVLAGSGTPGYDLEIDRMLTTADIQGHTHRPGFVESDQKDIILQGSDLFALTSYSENFGISVLEAMAAGTPTLLTPGVALSDVVESEQLGYVTTLDTQAIHDALIKALEYPEKNASTGKKAQLFVREHYSWHNIADQLTKTYAQILEITQKETQRLQHA
ncbi:MAG: glycosyltransferase [Cyanobacteria bacterium J06623_5]